MDEKAMKTIHALRNEGLGLDDQFRFHCTMCGRCCIDREDILLNPFDLYRMARELKMEPREVYEKYCESYLGNTSKMVVVRLLPVGEEKRCPLLLGKKCRVHKGKPTVCALFPLGRGIAYQKDSPGELSKAQIRYFKQDVRCGNISESHTVREWLSEFDLDAADTFFLRWSQAVLEFGGVIRELEGKVTNNTIGLLCAAYLGGLYLNYNTEEPFLPQFEKNRDSLHVSMERAGLFSQPLQAGKEVDQE